MAASAASPMASVEATTTGGVLVEWLKITAVPLLVFLLGACIWGCMQNTWVWSMLTEDGGSARNEAADSSRPIDNSHAAEDLEAGIEMPRVCRREDDRNMSMESTESGVADGRLYSPSETNSSAPTSDKSLTVEDRATQEETPFCE